MRVATVFKDEFKRSSWIIFVAVACLAVFTMLIEAGLMNNLGSLLNGNYAYGYVGINGMFMPVPILLALSAKRDKNDELWRSMPYTVNRLYLLRFCYGIVFIVVLGIAKIMAAAMVVNKYSILIEDFGYLGYEINGVYDLHMYLMMCVGAYVIINSVLTLVNNKAAACFMTLFAFLLPEMLYTVATWFGMATVCDGFDDIQGLKMAVITGCRDVYIIPFYYNIGCAIYLAFVAVMFFVGLYINKKRCESGSSKVFYNKGVKIVFIILSLLFVLNIIDVLFVQGGF